VVIITSQKGNAEADRKL